MLIDVTPPPTSHRHHTIIAMPLASFPLSRRYACRHCPPPTFSAEFCSRLLMPYAACDGAKERYYGCEWVRYSRAKSAAHGGDVFAADCACAHVAMRICYHQARYRPPPLAIHTTFVVERHRRRGSLFTSLPHAV